VILHYDKERREFSQKLTPLPGYSMLSVCRRYNVSQSPFCKRKSKYGGINADKAKRLKPTKASAT
jgi:hypothetical protein